MVLDRGCLQTKQWIVQSIERNYKGLRWLAEPEQGVFGGVYEENQAINRALSLNTNGQILEALLYAHIGSVPLEDWAHAKKN